jgi:hypothetical protein
MSPEYQPGECERKINLATIITVFTVLKGMDVLRKHFVLIGAEIAQSV